MKFSQSASLVVSTCALCACMPAPYGAYYRPAYPDSSSTLTKAYCGGQAGPPARLQFEGPEGVRISVSALRGYVDRKRADWPLSITISLPPGTRMQFLSDQLGTADSVSATPRALPVELSISTSMTVGAQDWVDYAAHGPTPVAIANVYLSAHPESALAQASLPAQDIKGFVPGTVRIDLPAIEIDGHTDAWPSMDLLPVDSRSGGRLYRSQAYTDSLLASQARCQAETPKLHCNYIVDADPYALNVTSGPFTFKGSTWVWDTAHQSPFSFNYELSARSTARWRFPTSSIRFRDAATGEVHESTFSTMLLIWRVQAPLSTPVHATTGGSNPRTGLLINASLGEQDTPHHFISLPPMLINGHTYMLKPIELELRLLDGGIEPFNC